MTSTLELVFLWLAAWVAVVGVFRAVNLPPVLGYLLVGALVGPHALKLLPDSVAARTLGEVGESDAPVSNSTVHRTDVPESGGAGSFMIRTPVSNPVGPGERRTDGREEETQRVG